MRMLIEMNVEFICRQHNNNENDTNSFKYERSLDMNKRKSRFYLHNNLHSEYNRECLSTTRRDKHVYLIIHSRTMIDCANRSNCFCCAGDTSTTMTPTSTGHIQFPHLDDNRKNIRSNNSNVDVSISEISTSASSKLLF